MDSIRESQKLIDSITNLKLELAKDFEHKLNIVLVEGSDDVRLIEKIMDKDIVCYESFSGKHGLYDLITSEEISDERIIAIRDKDYCDISDLPDRMYVYDTCCMETMIIKNAEIRNSLFDTYFRKEGNNEEEFEKILRELRPISILRKKNENDNLNIDFGRMGLLNCYDVDNGIDVCRIFKNLKLGSELYEACMTELENATIDELYNITNGHDLCKILGKIFVSGKGDMGENRVRDAIILSFRKGDFIKTDLYNKLLEYQSQHNLKYVEEKL